MGYIFGIKSITFAAFAISLKIGIAEAILDDVLLVFVGYILGSVNFSYLIFKKKTGKDIRTVGSGNAGASNLKRFLGTRYYIIALCLDIAKGAAATYLALWLTDDIVIISLTGAAAILGHSYPAWLGFRGGKSVAVTIGVFVPIAFWAVLIFAAVYFSLVYGFKYVSLGSMLGSLALFVSTLLMDYPDPVRILACFAFLMIVYRHRSNIARLVKGKELTAGDE